MDDEFKLCWKNFQDNIASGFQNLYDRGDLVDVTLACDGKLLHAHKFVLAICSPYFQEIFITNPCKHPTIFLKDVSFNIMCELLEFMYQGVVNVKHTELQSFMKVGQQLQIKGLATNSAVSPGSTTSEKSPSQAQQSDDGNNVNEEAPDTNNCPIKNENTKSESTNKSVDGKTTPSSPPLPVINSPALSLFKNTGNSSTPMLHHGTKRHLDFPPDALPLYARKQFRRSHHTSHTSSNDGNESTEPPLEQGNDDIFLPHFAMFEGRYEGKREASEHHNSPSTSAPTIRNPFGPAFNFDYNSYKNNSNSNNASEYPNELYMASEFSKSFGNHMEIPPNGANMVMLSSTSLLHGSCVFNRNNTVATQQGMKTYWLCKSYRISMCRARCITHQGRVISATGTHNHPPHMNGRNNGNAASNNNGNNQGSSVSGGGGGSYDAASQAPGKLNDNTSTGQQEANQALTGNNDSSLNISSTLRGGNGTNNSNLFNHNIHGNNDPQMHGPEGGAGTSSSQHLPPHPLPNLIGPHHGSGVHLHQNLMNNPNMMPLSAIPPMLTNVMHHHHHSPQLREHEANLEIVQMRSNESANSSSQSHHNVNTMPSPITIGNVNDNSSTNEKHVRRDEMHLPDDHHVLVHNAALSPSELNVGVERSHDDMRPREEQHHHQHQHHQQHNVHVIDSITISPTHRHSFKMESM